MNTEFLNNVTDFFKPAAETARALIHLNIATVEKVANVQLASVQANAELALANLKACIEVDDLDSAKAYAARQNEVAKTFYERLNNDSKILADIAKDYSAEAAKLVTQVVPASAPAPVAPKAKKAA